MAERRSAFIYINGKEIVNTMANIEAAVQKPGAEFKHLQKVQQNMSRKPENYRGSMECSQNTGSALVVCRCLEEAF